MSDASNAPTGPARYGRYYWCIKSNQSENGEIYAYADAVKVEDGHLLLYRDKDGELEPTLAFAPGSWAVFYAASVMDGSAVSVEQWAGEVLG